MPIRGLTDRQEGTFPQIGVIRKGAPKRKMVKDGKEIEVVGQELHHFRVEFDDKETEADQSFVGRFGKEPTDIIIVLPFHEIDRCWEAWRETYVAGALIHRCDGELVQYAINPRTGEKLVVGGIGPNGQPVLCKGKADGCKPVGRLRVIVPELKRLAYLVVMTTSVHDIINISDQLEGIASMNGGRLAGIPLVLRRRPKKISTPSGEAGKRARREKWLISIEADPEWVKAKLAKMHHDALPGNGLDAALQIEKPKQVASAGPEWSDELTRTGRRHSPDWSIVDEDDDEDEEQGEFESVAAPAVSEPGPQAQPPAPQENRKTAQTFGAQLLLAIVKKYKLVGGNKEVLGALGKSTFVTPADPDDIVMAWYERYQAYRINGDQPDAAAKSADDFIKASMASVAESAA